MSDPQTLTQCAEAVKSLRMSILLGPVGDEFNPARPLAKSEYFSAMSFLELAQQAFLRSSLAAES